MSSTNTLVHNHLVNLPTRLIIWAVFTAAGRDGCGPEFDHGGQEGEEVATRTGPLGYIYTRYWLNLQTASNYKAFNQCRGTDTYISPSSGPSCGYILCVVAGCHCRTGLASTTGREHQLLLSTSHTNADHHSRIG